MDLDSELEAWLTLSLTPGLSDADLRRLLVAFGGPQQVLSATRTEHLRVVPDSTVSALGMPVPHAQLRAVGAWLDDPANLLLTLGDSTYPQALLQIPDPPPLLYAK